MPNLPRPREGYGSVGDSVDRERLNSLYAARNVVGDVRRMPKQKFSVAWNSGLQGSRIHKFLVVHAELTTSTGGNAGTGLDGNDGSLDFRGLALGVRPS